MGNRDTGVELPSSLGTAFHLFSVISPEVECDFTENGLSPCQSTSTIFAHIVSFQWPIKYHFRTSGRAKYLWSGHDRRSPGVTGACEDSSLQDTLLVIVELVYKVKIFYLTPVNPHFSSVIVIVTSLLNTVCQLLLKAFCVQWSI